MHALERVIVPGRQLGDFLIERQIGAGGMGLVYRAQQISLNRPVALKGIAAPFAFLRKCADAISTRSRSGRSAPPSQHCRRLHDRRGFGNCVLRDGADRRAVAQPGDRRVATPSIARSAVVSSRSRCVATYWSKAHTAGPAISRRRPMSNASAAVDLSLLATADGYFAAVANLMADVADGLDYAHQMQVIHRDIKPSNLLLSRDGRNSHQRFRSRPAC